MENYNYNYKITCTNYYNNYCYIEGIFDVSQYINSSIDISVNSIVESNESLSFTELQVNSNDSTKLNSFKEYFLAKTLVKTNQESIISKSINIKNNYLILLLGIKLSDDSKFTNSFDFIYRFTLNINNIPLSPLYLGEVVANIAEIEILDSNISPSTDDSNTLSSTDNSNNCVSKEYVDSEIQRISSLIIEIQVYSNEELSSIDKKDNIIYLGY